MFYKLFKEKNISSFNAIKKFAKENNIKKIGHCGTLDPLAYGLLIVATNQDTKLIDYIYSEKKQYLVKAKLHYASDSYDEGSNVIKLENFKIVTRNMLLEAINKIKDLKTQLPPIYSAKKINGIRSYKLARKNQKVILKPIEIEIYDLVLKNFDLKNQTFELFLDVSKGTYVRSIVHDLAKMLGTDAVVYDLFRISIGNIKLDNDNEKFREIVDFSALFNVSLYSINTNELKALNSNKLTHLDNLQKENNQYLFLHQNKIVAYGFIKNGEVSFTKVFYATIQEIINNKEQN